MNTGESEDKKIKYMISTISPFVGLLAAIITAFTNLPAVIKTVLIILLSVITLVSVYVVCMPFFIKCIKTVKHYSLAKRYFSEFEKLVDRFGKLIEENHCDSMVYVLKDLQNKAMLNGILPFPSDFIQTFNTFVDSTKKIPIRKPNFLIMLAWFECVISLTNKYLICNPAKEFKKIDKGIIPNNCKEKYEECKLTYDRLLDDYENFARDLNKRFGERIARVYFEKPVKL